MKIHGYSQLTLLDYPGHLACTIFCGHCNFRCPFCHNASLVLHANEQPVISEEKIFEHLKKRQGILEGVAITGGEPTLHADLPDFIRRIRTETGLSVKLDTNGTNPKMLKELIEEGLIDYAAMDIKTSPARYALAAGLKALDMGDIFNSVEILMNSGIDYEFRTTIVDEIHHRDDLIEIGEWIAGAKAYYLQCYKDSGDLISPDGLHAPSLEKLELFRDIVIPFVPNTGIRGI
ncbi:MAG: anaerobic ribonucleoside-triphosphate reductase activating protein [Lachnospiraceae bacterium]|nr:anaerobic ribonucleoside-triphosphate reductase activating protein [Lachnospiraceae bacterium]